MPRSARSIVLAALVLAACQQSESRSLDVRGETASAGVGAADTSARALADTSIDGGRGGWLGDTTRALAAAPGAPARLEVDAKVPQGTVIGTSEPATPLCATGLRDPATGVTLEVVRSMQQTDKPLGSKDSTVWGRGDYRPSDPARFGLRAGQVLRVDCASGRVLGIAPDITTATPAGGR